MRKKKKLKLKIKTVGDEDAMRLWEGKKEVSLEECLEQNINFIKNYKSELLQKVGYWLKDNLLVFDGDKYNIEENIEEEDRYIEGIKTASELGLLYQQYAGILGFGYTLRYASKGLRFFRNKDKGVKLFWAIEEKRYKKLKKRIDEGENSLYS